MALWVGQTISQFGTYVALLTVPLLVLHIQEASGTENTLDFAIAYALETAPTLLVGLIGGVILDRIHLRPMMVATDLLRACAFFYLAAQVGSYGVGTVFAMAFIIGSMTTLFDGALYAMIPALVPKNRLSDANSFVTASIQANFALGPLVAGV
jgi:MFS family permease